MKISLSAELIKKIRELSGLRVTEFDYAKLSEWVERRIKILGLKGSIDYLDYLLRAPDLTEDRKMLSELLTTGETFFMRDPGQMELIRRVIFPEIIARKQAQKEIRIWAPACATGEEIYSLIILLEKVLPNSREWNIDIIGSDINPEFIDQARLAVYRDWSFRGCDQEFKNAYFQKVDQGWKLIERIRSRARFLVFDLVNDELPNVSNALDGVDFILCRNLFIYMNLEAINLITDKLASCLNPGGILMTAHGELHAYRKSGLKVKIHPESLVYEKSEYPDLTNVDEHFEEPSFSTGIFNLPLESALKKSTNVTLPTKSIEDLLSAAWHFADRGRFSESLEIYNQILLRNSMLPELHYLHAVISMELGDISRAKEDLRKTLYLDPNYLSAYLELITIQIQEGKDAVAAKYCEQAIKSLEKIPANINMPGLRNDSVQGVKDYLVNLQKSLTSVSE